MRRNDLVYVRKYANVSIMTYEYLLEALKSMLQTEIPPKSVGFVAYDS